MGLSPEAIDRAQAEIFGGDPGRVIDLGPFTSEITFTIIPNQEGDNMATTGTSMDGARQAQVPAQCAEVTDALEKLADQLGGLESRLECVLRPEAPIAADSQMKEARVGLVPLAEELASFARKLKQLRDNVDSIITRLEV